MWHLAPTTTRRIALFAVLVLAIVLWIIALVLLMEVTRQLLDTLRFIIEIARVG